MLAAGLDDVAADDVDDSEQGGIESGEGGGLGGGCCASGKSERREERMANRALGCRFCRLLEQHSLLPSVSCDAPEIIIGRCGTKRHH